MCARGWRLAASRGRATVATGAMIACRAVVIRWALNVGLVPFLPGLDGGLDLGLRFSTEKVPAMDEHGKEEAPRSLVTSFATCFAEVIFACRIQAAINLLYVWWGSVSEATIVSPPVILKFTDPGAEPLDEGKATATLGCGRDGACGKGMAVW